MTTTTTTSLTASDLRGYDDITFTEGLFNYKVTFSSGVASNDPSIFIECIHKEDGDRWTHTMTSQNCDEDLEEQERLISPRDVMKASYARLLPLSPKYLYKILHAHKNGEIDDSISIIFPNKIKDIRTPIYIEISIKLPHFDDHDILRRIKLGPVICTDIDRVQYRFGHLQKKIHEEILEMKKLSSDMESKVFALDKTPEISSLRSNIVSLTDMIAELTTRVVSLETVSKDVVTHDTRLTKLESEIAAVKVSVSKNTTAIQQVGKDTDTKLAACTKRLDEIAKHPTPAATVPAVNSS